MKADWFKDRLRELRAAAGLTQQQLAERAGMTREGIAQLEIGRREPAWGSVVALAIALGVGCDAFLQPPATEEGAARSKGRPRKAQADAGEAADQPEPEQGEPSGEESKKRKPGRKKP